MIQQVVFHLSQPWFLVKIILDTDDQCSELSSAKLFSANQRTGLGERWGKITNKDFKLCIQLASCGWLSCLNDVDHLKIEAMTFRLMYNMLRFCMGEDERMLREKMLFCINKSLSN